MEHLKQQLMFLIPNAAAHCEMEAPLVLRLKVSALKSHTSGGLHLTSCVTLGELLPHSEPTSPQK